ncbi:MAG: YceI family protein [Armatimonadota bacterium]|nr:YceI family protein [Armatimonadota bacterium]
MRQSWLAGVLIVLQAPTLLPVGTFRVDPGDSRVEFVMRDNRGGFTGATDRVEGTVTVTQPDAETFAAAVDARVDARTLHTGNGIRDGQMRRDFLRVDEHPYLTFRGSVTSRERPTAGPMRVVLRGALTIRGTTRDVEIPLSVTALADEYRAAGELTVRLSAFGIPTPRFLIFVAEDPRRCGCVSA